MPRVGDWWLPSFLRLEIRLSVDFAEVQRSCKLTDRRIRKSLSPSYVSTSICPYVGSIHWVVSYLLKYPLNLHSSCSAESGPTQDLEFRYISNESNTRAQFHRLKLINGSNTLPSTCRPKTIPHVPSCPNFKIHNRRCLCVVGGERIHLLSAKLPYARIFGDGQKWGRNSKGVHTVVLTVDRHSFQRGACHQRPPARPPSPRYVTT